MTPSKDRKTALITGANKGIGLEIARQLGTQGITVLVGARDRERGRVATEALRAEGIDAHSVTLDVTDEASIGAAAQEIEQQFGKLDILVNNAAVALDRRPPSQLDLETFRRTYETNVFGIFAVTCAMLPLLRKAPAPRIVNMASGLASLTQTSDPNSPLFNVNLIAYNSSKTAINALTVQFANELRDTPIKVNSADPGYVATDLNQHSGPRTVQQGAKEPVRLATLPADGPTGRFFNEDGPLPW
jgi:NAD(P)-dependent dehydrogenase (short-subunit alcohol dehydrogenase family)